MRRPDVEICSKPMLAPNDSLLRDLLKSGKFAVDWGYGAPPRG
jgi:hypothetical protein